MTKRRAQGEGSIFKRADRDVYVYKFTIEINGKKITRKVTDRLKRVAKEKGEALRAKLLAEAEGEDVRELTLGEYLDQWLAQYVEGHVSVKTLERYRTAVKNHIVPILGDEPLGSLNSLKIQKFINELREQGTGKRETALAPRTVNTARTVLGTALKQAECDELITKNPIPFTKRAKIERAEIQVLSQEDCQKLVAAAKEEKNLSTWIACVIALETGLRKGEVFGLHWSDIDFGNKTLTINRTVINGNSGMMVQNSTKTQYSRRTVCFTDSLRDKLREYYQWQKLFLQGIGAESASGGFLITSAKGTLRDPNRFTYVDYKRVLSRAGLDTSIRFHDLRHTHATLLLSAGVDIKTVSARLGHTSIKITLDTYAHVLPTMNDSLLEKLDELKLT